MTAEEETFNKLNEPAPETDNRGTKRWFNEKGQKHRDNDLPAVIYYDGIRFWFKNGEIHRENGPAIIGINGRKEYWENGEFIK